MTNRKDISPHQSENEGERPIIDTETNLFLKSLGEKYYHHILKERHKAGRFLEDAESNEIPGWPYPYTEDKKKGL